MSELPIIGGGGSSYILSVTSVDASDYVASGGGTPGDVDLSGGDVYVTDALEVDGYATFGSGSTSHSLGANGDVYVEGKLEVDSDVEMDGTVYFNSSASFGNLKLLILGGTTQNDLVIYGNRTVDQAVCMVGDQVGRQLVLSNGAMFGKDFGHADAGFPVLYLQSDEDPTVDATEFMSAAHNGTNGILQTGKGNLTIGSGSTSHSLNANGDTLVSGALEVDSDLWADGSLKCNSSVVLFDDKPVYFGTTNDGVITFNDANQTVPCLMLLVDDTSNTLIFNSKDNRFNDHAHSAQTDPTLYGHSGADVSVDATQWWSITHDQTNGVIQTGKGNLTIGSGSTSRSLNSNGDLFVSGKLEVDGVSYLDSQLNMNAALLVSGTNVLFFDSAGASDTKFRSLATDNAFLLSPGSNHGRNLVISEEGNTGSSDSHGLSVSDDPTIWLFSSIPVEYSKQEHFSLAHDGDDAVFQSGHGGYVFGVPAQSARGTVTFTGVPVADETITINATTITFKADGSGDMDHCTIGGTAAECVTNLVTTLGECSESANLSAWDGAGDTVVIEWGTAGVAGNSIAFSGTPTNVSLDGSGFFGGTHAGVDAATLLTVPETGPVKVGSGTPGNATTDGSLYVTDRLECDGTAYLGPRVYVTSVYASNYAIPSDDYGVFSYKADDGVQLALGSSGKGNNNLIITAKDNLEVDHQHSGMSINPTLIGHSVVDPTSDATQWWSITHDQTNGVIQTGKGNLSIGSGSTARSLNSNGDLFVSGDAEVTGKLWLEGGAQMLASTVLTITNEADIKFGSSTQAAWKYSTSQTANCLVVTSDDTSRNIIYSSTSLRNKDHGHAASCDPTLFVHAAVDPTTRDTDYATIAYDRVEIGADYGAFCGLKSLTEEVTISVGNGSGGIATSGNLAPEASLIMGVAVRCTDAPGGGATEYDVGITGSGNQDSLIAGAGVGLGDTAVSASSNDGTALPIMSGSATTLTITTDGDVTVDEMKVRVTVFYFDMSAPQS